MFQTVIILFSYVPNIYFIANNPQIDADDVKNLKIQKKDIIVKFNRCNYNKEIDKYISRVDYTFHYFKGDGTWWGFDAACNFDCTLNNSTTVVKITGPTEKCETTMNNKFEHTFISIFHDMCKGFTTKRIHGGTIGILHMNALYPNSVKYLIGFTAGICDEPYSMYEKNQSLVAENHAYLSKTIGKMVVVRPKAPQ